MGEGTDLYRRTVAYDYGDAERNDLMRRIWTPTPWMVSAFTGRCTEDRDRKMRNWCRDQFGYECFPIHKRPGTWQRGTATINGWTWFGFATEAQMRQFEEAWPSPSDQLEAHPLPGEAQ